MIGAIIGDIVGSRFEFNNTDKYDFELFTRDCDFTDDTICTIAVADALLRGISFKDSLLEWCRKYPNPMGEYGGSFKQWLQSSDPQPYNSYGNGSAMRVSPCAYAAYDDVEAIRLAYDSAACTHNHAEGVIGAIVVTRLICTYRSGSLDAPIEAQRIVSDYYGEDWYKHLPRKGLFDVTCQGCVPLAYKIVDDSDSFEDAIRAAVAHGGDSDTLAAIVGSIAEAVFVIPDELKEAALRYLPEEMKQVVHDFYETYIDYE